MSYRFRSLALIALAAIAVSAMERAIPLRSISALFTSTFNGSTKRPNELKIRLPPSNMLPQLPADSD